MSRSILPYAAEDAGATPSLHADYRATALRSPREPLLRIPQTLTETTGPADWGRLMGAAMADLTTQHKGAPQGQRIIVQGRVLDDRGRPVPDTVVEIWQANAAGRYVHVADQHPAPLDPNFSGAGRVGGATVDGPLEGTEVGRCIERKVAAVRFPAHPDGTLPWDMSFDYRLK